jgi:hypothetical protein
MSGNQIALTMVLVIAALSLLFAFVISRKRGSPEDCHETKREKSKADGRIDRQYVPRHRKSSIAVLVGSGEEHHTDADDEQDNAKG